MLRPIRTYMISRSRLDRSRLTGMEAADATLLRLKEGVAFHAALFPVLTAEEKHQQWGRLWMEGKLAAENTLTVRAFAADDKEAGEAFLEGDGWAACGRLFERDGCLCGTNCMDMLLYGLHGKYLWIYMEITGTGGGFLRDIRVESGEGRFLRTFPEIYREEGNFFGRYLSVFSSLYQDMQEEIDEVHVLLDLDRAPGELLGRYAGWLGLELEGELPEEEAMRALVKEAYSLNRIKGTRQAILRLVRLVLGQEAIIVERGLLQGEVSGPEQKAYDRLYGCGAQDITILVRDAGKERQRVRLLFLLEQFKPARSRIRLIEYGNCARLDSYCYMDLNARLCSLEGAVLDRGIGMDGCVLAG